MQTAKRFAKYSPDFWFHKVFQANLFALLSCGGRLKNLFFRERGSLRTSSHQNLQKNFLALRVCNEKDLMRFLLTLPAENAAAEQQNVHAEEEDE